MSTQEAPSIISESLSSGSSPIVLTLRTSGNTVPTYYSAYVIEKIVVEDESAGANDVVVQNLDGSGPTVETDVTIELDADESKTVGGEQVPVLRIHAGNQIRVAVDGDADITVYLSAE